MLNNDERILEKLEDVVSELQQLRSDLMYELSSIREESGLQNVVSELERIRGVGEHTADLDDLLSVLKDIASTL